MPVSAQFTAGIAQPNNKHKTPVPYLLIAAGLIILGLATLLAIAVSHKP